MERTTVAMPSNSQYMLIGCFTAPQKLHFRLALPRTPHAALACVVLYLLRNLTLAHTIACCCKCLVAFLAGNGITHGSSLHMCTRWLGGNVVTWKASTKTGTLKWTEPGLVWEEGSFNLEHASDDRSYCKASFVPLKGGEPYSIDMAVLWDLAVRPFDVFVVQGPKVVLCRRQLVGDDFPPVKQNQKKKKSKVHS
jgi:hypothetical protein